MNFSESYFWLCSFIVVALLAVSCNCQHDRLVKHEVVPKKFMHFSQEHINLSKCQPGDYYIISQILVYYVAYVAKYRGVQFEENCPVGIAAGHTFAHIRGSNTFFWKRATGTIQMIFVNDELEFLVQYLNTLDIVKIFNELVGYNGTPLSSKTAIFAESFKTILLNFLDQRNGKELFLNLNGVIVYGEIFPDCGINLDPKTSPLCELATITTPYEFVEIVEYRSTIVPYLRSLSDNALVGSNEKDFKWPSCEEYSNECWKYTFGCASLFERLSDDIHTIFVEAGYPNHHTDKFTCMAHDFTSLLPGGLANVKSLGDIFKLVSNLAQLLGMHSLNGADNPAVD